MDTDEMELRIELALIQLEALRVQLNLLQEKIDLARALYGTPQRS
jgi:hypothetical protein